MSHEGYSQEDEWLNLALLSVLLICWRTNPLEYPLEILKQPNSSIENNNNNNNNNTNSDNNKSRLLVMTIQLVRSTGQPFMTGKARSIL